VAGAALELLTELFAKEHEHHDAIDECSTDVEKFSREAEKTDLLDRLMGQVAYLYKYRIPSL
jgi:hypothetical protein